MFKNLFFFIGLCWCTASTLSAQINVNFTGGVAVSNQTIDVDVSVSNFNEIVSAQFSINWDPSVAEFVSVENVTEVLPSFSQSTNIGIPVGAQDIGPGQLTVSWSLPTTEPVTIPDNTVLFTIRLRAIGAACATTDLLVTDSPRRIEVTDTDLNNIGIAAGQAMVMVEGDNCDGTGNEDGICDDSPNFSFIIEDVTVSPDGNTCIPVLARNFDNISGITIGFQWNASLLSYTGARDGALNQILFNEGSADTGELGMQWISFTQGVNVADRETLFELCFDVNGNVGQSTDITFGRFGINIDVEVVNADEQQLELCLDKGNVSIGQGDTGGDDCNTTSDYAMIIDDQNVNAGERVCIPVLTRNHDNIQAVKTSFSWDTSVLSFVEFQNGGLSGLTVNDENAQSGEVVLLWDSAFASTLEDGSALFDICFDVVGDIGDRAVIVIDSANDTEILNSDLVLLATCFKDGTITVGEGDTGQPPVDDFCDGTDHVTLEIKNAEVFENRNICLPVTSRNFDDLVRLQTSFNWDVSQLRFTGLNEVSLQGVQLNSNLAESGELQFIWSASSDFDGLSLNDDAVLFELCFDAVGDRDSFTDVEIGESNVFSTEILREGIMSDGGNPPDPEQDLTCENSSDVSFIMENKNAAPGSNVCLNVTAKNFTDVTSFFFSFTWDPAKLSYSSATAREVPGIVVNAADDLLAMGQFNMLWFTPNGFGFDIVDDAILFDVCFDVLSSENEDISVLFGESGVNASVTVGDDNVEVPFCRDFGVVLVRDGTGSDTPPTPVQSCFDFGRMTIREFIPPPVLPVQIEAGTGTVAKDAEICIDITVDDFVDIQSMQFNLAWDASVLRYERIINPNVLNTFGLVNVNLNADNLLTVSWNPFSPQTLEGRTVIFSACFTGIGDCTIPESTSLDFVDSDDIDIEFTNDANDILEVIDRSGRVTLEMCDINNEMPVFTVTALENVSCFGANDGSIRGNVSGTNGGFTCRWFDSAGNLVERVDNGCDVDGLAPGVYTLRLSNENGLFEQNYTITGPEAIELRVNRIEGVTCTSLGEISLSTSGGTEPYQYNWDNGLSDKEDHNNVLAGQYNLTITDANGCVFNESFTIDSDVEDLAVQLEEINDVSCSTEQDGSIRISVSGGCGPFNYSWTGPDFQSSDQNIFDLAEGVYFVTVTDSGSDQASFSGSYNVAVGGDLSIGATVGDVTVIEGDNGSININVTGENTTGIMYEWSDGSTDSDRNGLMPGMYELTITQDGSNCAYFESYEVKWAAIFADNIDFDGSGVVCPDGDDATIEGAVIGGCGAAEIRVNGIAVEGLPLDGLGVGTYEIEVQDSCGNQDSKILEVTNFEPIEIAVQNINCSEEDNGSFELDIEGGSGVFDINWPPPGIISDSLQLTELPPGEYTVLVSDLLCLDQEMSAIVTIVECDGTPPPSNNCTATPILTPNGDGLNETFELDCLENGANQPNTLTIYNRWGQLVFAEDNYENDWMGTGESGEQLVPGGYMWVLEATNPNGSISIDRGSLTILSDNF